MHDCYQWQDGSISSLKLATEYCQSILSGLLRVLVVSSMTHKGWLHILQASRKSCCRCSCMSNTWNISPAPSQSLVVMRGVCTYMNPLDWKNVWVAWARALRMRATAPIRLVLGRRWSRSRKLSMLCPFLLRGYFPLPLSHLPNHKILLAFSSTFCRKGQGL